MNDMLAKCLCGFPVLWWSFATYHALKFYGETGRSDYRRDGLVALGMTVMWAVAFGGVCFK